MTANPQEFHVNSSKVYMSEPYSRPFTDRRLEDQMSYKIPVLEQGNGIQRSSRPYCATLPMNIHHLLQRQYIPSSTFWQRYPGAKEKRLWVGVDMDLSYLASRTREEFIGCLIHAFDNHQFYVCQNPEESPCVDRGFWMQIRGYFPGPGYDLIERAAKLHIYLLAQLVEAKYISLVLLNV